MEGGRRAPRVSWHVIEKIIKSTPLQLIQMFAWEKVFNHFNENFVAWTKIPFETLQEWPFFKSQPPDEF